MKKFLFFLGIFFMLMVSCDKDDYPYDDFRPTQTQDNRFGNGNNGDGNNGSGTTDSNITPMEQRYEIIKLYTVVMRRELPYPFSAYVLQIDNGKYFYMLRYRYNQDLHVGDKISFSVFTYCPNEIAVINGCSLGDGSDTPTGYNNIEAGEYLVASDPIEATMNDAFSMKIRYSLTFLPIETVFIETTSGELLFIKRSKLNVSLAKGDRFVYSVYTLFPNEILALKKL